METFPPCTYYKKTNHQPIKCRWRPDIKCRKCGQIGHVERICRTQQHEEKANPVAQQPEEKQLFVASCFSTENSLNDSWLIDGGCTNHMTNNQICSKNLTKRLFPRLKLEMVIILMSKAKELLS